jgi:hypothetical protein
MGEEGEGECRECLPDMSDYEYVVLEICISAIAYSSMNLIDDSPVISE